MKNDQFSIGQLLWLAVTAPIQIGKLMVMYVELDDRVRELEDSSTAPVKKEKPHATKPPVSKENKMAFFTGATQAQPASPVKVIKPPPVDATKVTKVPLARAGKKGNPAALVPEAFGGNMTTLVNTKPFMELVYGKKFYGPYDFLREVDHAARRLRTEAGVPITHTFQLLAKQGLGHIQYNWLYSATRCATGKTGDDITHRLRSEQLKSLSDKLGCTLSVYTY